MKKFLFSALLLFVFASICFGEVLVYNMTCLEDTFDLGDSLPGLSKRAVHGFVAIDVNLLDLTALQYGDSMWTLKTAVVKFGRTNGAPWRCEQEPLVWIYRLADNRLSISFESFDVNESNEPLDDFIFEVLADANDPNDLNDPNEIPIPDPNEPNEPGEPEPAEPNGIVTGCYSCFMYGNEPNNAINLGGFVWADVPRVFRGRCIFNGDRIKGSSRCVLVLNRRWTRMANNSGYSPPGIREKFCDRRLTMFTHLGPCCDPNSLPVVEPGDPNEPSQRTRRSRVQ
ncbi:MAG: hypothetical protein WC374_07090 [Phycisphaerae bacterium]|jgi:hypothetical protein